MRAGPKVDTAAAGPLPLSPTLGRMRPGPGRLIRWIESHLTIPSGYGAGEPMRLHPFQKEFIKGAFGAGIRVGCLSCPRGQGKTGLLAAVALAELFDAPTWGPRIYCTASSERQAGHLFDACRAMVALNPALASRAQVHATGRIFVPYNDGLLSTLPASSRSLQGLKSKLVICDEAAEVETPTAEALALSMGKVPASRMICISTAPISEDSFWNRWRTLGLSGEDDSLHWSEYSAPDGAYERLSDPAVFDEVVRACNPAIAAGFLDIEAIRSDYRKVRPASFERWRLGRTTENADTWLPFGVFAALASPRPVPDGARVVLGFDGSVSGDSTVLIGATVDPEPYVFVLGAWEAPSGPAGLGWSVPRVEVSEAVRTAYSRFSVVELAADPPYWRSELQEWARIYPGVVEFPSHVPARMGPATDLVYSLIAEKKLTHDGSEVLVRHCRNAVVRATAGGDVVSKNHKDSPRRIDAAIGMILAVSRAVWWANQPVKRNRIFVGSYT